MQKVIQHLMDFLANHLSSEDKACLWSVGRFWASSRTTGRGVLHRQPYTITK